MKNFIWIILLTIIFSFGCSNTNQNNDVLNQGEIKTITENDLRDILKNRNGKILFLNVWATWCVPCVEEFPAIVQLDSNYKDKDVEVIALSVDLPADVDDKIIPFLKEQNAGFKVYVAEEKSSDEIIDMLNPEWSGAIPASFIYDEHGIQQRYLLGSQSYEQMKKVIDSVSTL